MPTVIFVDSFDHYATADLSKKGWSGSASPGITAAQGRNGTACLKLTDSSNNWYNVTQSFASVQTGYVEFAFKTDAFHGADSRFIEFLDSGSPQCDVRVTATGQLRVTRAGTSLGVTAGPVLTVATYYHIGVKFRIDNTAGEAEVRVNGAPVLTLAAQDTQQTAIASFNQVRIFNMAGGNQPSYFDDFIISTDGFCGDCRVVALLPQAPGNYSQWTPSAGLGWQCVDDPSMNSDTDYVSSSVAGQRNSYDFAAAGATGSVKAVQQVTTCRKDDAGSRTIKQFARVSSTDYDAASATAVTDAYVMQRRVYLVNPATSADWTVSEINASEFGTKLEA